MSSFLPRKGQWVGVTLSPAATVLAEDAGAWKTRQGHVCGIYAGDSRAPDGNVVTLPARIALVGGDGANVVRLVGGCARDCWCLAPGSTDEPGPWEELGCLGRAIEMVPIVNRIDCPPGRRPDYDPRP